MRQQFKPDYCFIFLLLLSHFHTPVLCVDLRKQSGPFSFFKIEAVGINKCAQMGWVFISISVNSLEHKKFNLLL